MSSQLLPLVVVYGPGAGDADGSRVADAGAAAEWQSSAAGNTAAALQPWLAAGRVRVAVPAAAGFAPGWLQRLLAALAALPAGAALTTLGGPEPRLSPLPPGSAAPVQPPATLDLACWLLDRRLLWPLEPGLDSGVLALPATTADLDGPRLLCASLCAGAAAAPLPAPPALPRDPRERAAEPLWSELAERLQALPEAPALAPVGLDGKPVVLHLLHGWGGGAERWVLDLAASDPQRHHLLLRAISDPLRRQHGTALQLVDARAPQLELRRERLAPPIATLADRHPQYRQLLLQVMADFRVDQLWVSSLIGHALDALRLPGLPLRWIGHDHFPFWPVLHADFGDPARRFDSTELAAELAAEPAGPMQAEPAATWQARRQATIAALLEREATLVAPSQSVRRNLARLAPPLAARPWQVIGHGIAALAPLPPPPARALPRLLVLGRINGGKGEQLLAQALPALTAHCELYLLGCGSAGMRFFGQPGVHVELEFEHATLAAQVARIAPDAALLPRTVAETFSYVLSELWALAVPPLATRLGSLAERIEHGVDGWLCAPEAEALVAAVAALAAAPAELAAMRARLAARPPRDLAAMQRDYQPLLPAAAQAAMPVYTIAAPAALHGADLGGRLLRCRSDLGQLQVQFTEAEAELQKRGDWGRGLQRQVDERTAWALSLQQTIDQERAQAMLEQQRLAASLAAAQDGLQQAEAALQAQLQVLAASREQHDATVARLQAVQQHEAALTAWLDQAQIHLAQARARIAELEGSSSWRLTAPLRHAVSLLRRLREALAFRARSARQLLRRGVQSLRQRGLAATLQRLLQGRPAAPLQTIETAPLAAPEQPFEPFALPERGAPRVSVVIPVYNKFAYTEACLRALARVVDDTPFETIVVDDCSSDPTWERLGRIGGIVAHRNAANLGFIGACNQGAQLARGEYVFFLNNDTQVQDGFLAELLRVFASRPDAGLVGSKLIYPDGRLQESGGIVFRDGSGWNYGRFDDPQACQYSYVREVDYVSGAAIMLPRALFWQLGGFDTHYAPAYYEDTDLAFKVRAQAGRKVYVAPASRVVHFEGITGGTDTSTGIKRYQVVNQEKFLARWAGVLASHPAPGTPIELAREHRVRRRVLVIDACTPMPDQDSGSLRMFNLLRLLLAEGSAVSFFAENRAYHAGYAEALQALGVEALFHPWLPEAPEFLRARGAHYDLVILSRHYVAESFLPLVRAHCPNAVVWFDTVDLHYLRERRAAELAGDAAGLRQAERTQAQECALMQRCDLTLVVSTTEQELLARDCPQARVEILSNIHDIPGRRRPRAERQDLFFVGGFQHPPNVDAVLWFVEAVWPLVLAARPQLKLHLVGSRTPREIEALAGPNVQVHGHVADLDPFLDGCVLSIAPLRYGAGVKGKVNLSMSHGCPVVATPVAVEGMHLQAGVDALVADTPAEFAAAILHLHDDEALWHTLSDAGLANVERHFSLAAARAVLQRLLDPAH